jgi:hypothetical protein
MNTNVITTMDLKQRIQLALTLSPAIWLFLVWIYMLSPNQILLSIPVALAYSYAMALTCSYCVVLFINKIRS